MMHINIHAIVLGLITLVPFLFVVTVVVSRARPALRKRLPTMGAPGRLLPSLALGLCVPASYFSTWSFYGVHGKAMLGAWAYLGFYAGPAAIVLLWPFLLVRIIKISRRLSATDLVGFVCRRYGDSGLLKTCVISLILAGTVPYLSVQLLGIARSLVYASASRLDDTSTLALLTLFVAVCIFVFLLFSRVSQIRAIVAFLGLVMILTIAGLAILLLSSPPADSSGSMGQVHSTASETGRALKKDMGPPLSWWTSTFFLSMMAILFLPRQFHILTQETGAWTPQGVAKWTAGGLLVYFIVFCLSTMAMHRAAAAWLQNGGAAHAKLLSGEAAPLALASGYRARLSVWPIVVVLLGGFAAGVSTISCQLLALGHIVSHHIVGPMARGGSAHSPAKLRRIHKRAYWISVTILLVIGFAIAILSRGKPLPDLGLISFLAAAQLVPAILGGMYWKNASKAGAIAGIFVGSILWSWTIVVPVFAPNWLEGSQLCPRALVGLTGIGNITHCALWSLGANVLTFVVVSLFTHKEDAAIVASYVGVGRLPPLPLEPETRTFVRNTLQTSMTCRTLAFLVNNGGMFYKSDEVTARGCLPRPVVEELSRLVRAGLVMKDRGEYVYLDPNDASLRDRAHEVALGCALVDDLPAFIEQREAEIKHRLDKERRAIQHLMAGGLGHALQSRIGLVQTWIGILKRRLEGRHADIMEIFEDSARFLARAPSLFRRLQRTRDTMPRHPLMVDVIVANLVRRYADPRIRMSLPGRGVVVLGDEIAAEDAFDQVIQNAREFVAPAPEGRIDITLRRSERGCVIEVADNGPGINPDIKDRLFEPGARYPDSRLGLGLMIARALVEAQGGALEEKGEAGEGARFQFILPLAEGDADV